MSGNSLASLTPLLLRSGLRKGKFKKQPTTFTCKGYKQANLVVLHAKYAEDFHNFAKYNQGALPLLHTSKPGKFDAPALCSPGNDSDVRTDLPSYNKYINGKFECQLDNLLEFDLSQYASFYIGCSFSFSDILVSHGVISDDESNSNVSMYITSIDCLESGPFKCKMIVSMRALKRSKLSLVATLCEFMHDVHGPPVHYGNPKAIGIADINKIDYGCVTPLNDDEIPVFWCCGVTGIEALKSAGVELAFSHSPGHMFVSDVLEKNQFPDLEDPAVKTDVIEYNSKSTSFSALAAASLSRLNDLNAIAQQDFGDRKIKNLVVAEDFAKSALALSHASSVALVTGFPARLDNDPPDETDGLPGIFSLAAVLQSLGKRVVLFVDEYALNLNKNIVKKLVEKGLLRNVDVVPYVDGETSLLDERGIPVYDVIVASERVGRAADGKYYSMRGGDVSSRVSPFDDLFAAATAHPDVTTIGIGDGGNELGMGKVLDRIQSDFPLGEKIACTVEADLLISVGVSNWGCYALGLALYVLTSCPVHDRYRRRAVGFHVDAFEKLKGVLPSVERERAILQTVEEFGIADGVKPDQEMSVDGMFFDQEHTTVLKAMIDIANITDKV